MDQGTLSERSTHGSPQQGSKSQNGRSPKWDTAVDILIFLWFFLGLAIIFANVWVPLIPYVQYAMEVVGDPFLFILSVVLAFSILWNVSFYLDRRKELLVARKLIRYISSQRDAPPRTDKECERIDRVLKKAIWELRNSEDVSAIVEALQEGTRGGEALPEGWARSHYEKVIGHLDAAAGKDQVLAWDARLWDLEIGEKMLWATRAENLNRTIP